jgi:hypothetical protein
MKSIETNINIKATPEKIWNILMDFENYGTWNPFIQSIKGERSLGKQLEASIGLGEKGMTFKPIVQVVEKNCEFEWLGSLLMKGIFDGRHSFVLEPISETETKLIHSESFSGIFSGIILKMIKEDTEKGFKAMNEALKKRAENY